MCTSTGGRLALLLLVWQIGAVAIAQPQVHGEYEVKAALLLNFSRFVTGPEERPAPFVFAIAGDPSLADALQLLTLGKNVTGRAIAVRHMPLSGDLSDVDVLFVDRGERQVAAALQRAGSGTLTVGDGPQFLREGGMIRVFLDGTRFRFQIDVDRVQRAGLRVHSQLLGLSTR